MADGPGYRFEPLQRRGLLLGLGPGQLAVAAVSVVAAVGLVTSLGGAGGFLAATAVAVLGALLCRPVAGRPPLEWAVASAAFAVRRRPWVAAPPGATPASPPKRLPPIGTLAPGTRLAELAASGAQGPVGVVLDERSATAAAVLRAGGGAFCLLDGPDKERKLAAWAAVLESLSAHRSELVRLQWCQRARPASSDRLLRLLERAGDQASPGFAGHAALLERAGARAWRHETFLVVAVRCPANRRRLSQHGAAALRTEVHALRARLRDAGIACEGILDAQGLAAALGSFLVPGLDRHPFAHPWPLAFEEHWSDLHVDGHWYRTYWVADWPRSHVGPDFLSPLLVGRGRRSFSVVMAPVPPERAARDAESSRTAHIADAQLRAHGGFLETARDRRRAEAVEEREVELAEGRGAFQLAGYVTASAGEKAELEQACAELERAAGAARLCLRTLYGRQRDALTWALPFGRGL
ncbi:MAG: SCO6880 family protein [Acidimicrobiales bacterium]